MDDEELPTLSQLKALRVVDLKEKLSRLGLPQSGLKADLINRLDGHFNKIREQRVQQQLQQQQQMVPPQLSMPPDHGLVQLHSQPQLQQMASPPMHHPAASTQMMSPQHNMLSPQNQQMHQQILSPPHQQQLPSQIQLSPGGHLHSAAVAFQAPVIQQVYEPAPSAQVMNMVQQQQQHQQYVSPVQEPPLIQASSIPQPVLLEQRQQPLPHSQQQQQEETLEVAGIPVKPQDMPEEPAAMPPQEQQPDQSMTDPEVHQAEPEAARYGQETETRIPVVEEPCIAKHVEPLYEEQGKGSQPTDTDNEKAKNREVENVPSSQPQTIEESAGNVESVGGEHERQVEAIGQSITVPQQAAAESPPINESYENAEKMNAQESDSKEQKHQEQELQDSGKKGEEEHQTIKHASGEMVQDATLSEQAEPSLSKPPLTVFPKAGAVVEKAPAIIHRIPQQRSQVSDDLEDDPTPAGPIHRSSELKSSPDSKEQDNDVHLPKALEDALERQKEVEKEEAVVLPRTTVPVETVVVGNNLEEDEVVVEKEGEKPEGKAGSKAKGGKKKKKKKKNRPQEWARQAAEAERRKQEEEERANEPEVEVEYIQEKIDLDPSDPMYRTFSKIFDAFKISDEDDEKAKSELNEAEHKKRLQEGLTKVPKQILEDDDDEDKMKDDADGDEDEDGKQKLSKRKLKKLNRLSVAELKQLVARPDVVEMHDVTARDPRLLVHLKSTRNTVPVPRHWCFKRKYLQGKRGIEKPPFDLPDFIKKTGIMEMRAALQEKEESKGMKAKMREKVRPKLGKIDIDYQKLHDAFFKWQTKPRMTLHGDLYYEGKEFEIRLKEKKPGDLTDDLRTSLGMPVGPNAHKVPPPWLIAMQRYGPPPSYPNLKIPGLNAPIPDGCSFGYHAGGWGKPPVDESGKPLYGDVFGTSDPDYGAQIEPEEIDMSLWGELESEEEEEEEEESSEEEGGAEEAEGEAKEGEEGVTAAGGLQTPVIDAGLTTPSGMSSVGLGMGGETPELLELRKRRIEAEMESGEQTPNLYQVLPEKRAGSGAVGSAMMGSTHTYDIRKATDKSGGGGAASSLIDTGGVELALNPEEVDLMDTDAMQARAEAAIREKQASLAKEDLSDMVAEHAAKQSSKRKRAAAKDDRKDGGGAGGGSAAKKYKDFKF